MAGGSDGNVKKGFFFYFGLFVLFIVAVMMVIFVVMMFMPGTSILGMQYFSSTQTIHVTQTTDKNQTQINFNQPNFGSVEINAGYADVTIQKNNDYKQNGVYIVNNAKGFVTSADAVEFDYSAVIENGTLKISVTEPNGFLYFSKDVQIVLQISNESINPFAGKSVSIKTTDGDINIGSDVNAGYSYDVEIGSLTAESGKGSIVLTDLSPSTYTNLNLKTTSGKILFHKQNVNAQNISLQTSSGNISASTLRSNNVITLNSDSGKIDITTISSFASKCKNVYMTIDTVSGNADFSPSQESFDSSVINITNINGWITANNARKTNFNLTSVQGIATIQTQEGNISINRVQSHSVLSTQSGQISTTVAPSSTNITLSTKEGVIDVAIPLEFSGVTIENIAGTTNVTMADNIGVTIKFGYVNLTDEFNFDKVSLNNPNLQPANPLVVGNGESTLNLNCNQTINFNWLKSA